MVRSGIILPFQFRDCKKLLMIGVPEENRELSIWDLKNVVRAAFGIYNFEFRNKKIGFNIPDELLLHYLEQRHDLTNFVIEIGQAFDPCKDNYTLPLANCSTCRCAAQKSLDIHETNTSISNHLSHSSINSLNSQNADEPPLKVRITNPTTMQAAGATSTAADLSHFDIQPKIDYDAAVVGGGGGSGVGIAADDDDTVGDDDVGGTNVDCDNVEDDSQSHHNKPNSFMDDEHQHPQHPQHQAHDMHFERMQHEYFLQAQQQQQHMEVLLHEASSNSLRQRKERMSKKQKEIYVNFLEQNPQINEHRRSDPLLDRYWVKLADILNSVPQGAVKHVAEWKQTFDNWRYRIYLYARYNSKISGEDATNPKCFKPLTHTDKRAYSMWIRNPDTAPPDLEKMRNVFVNLEETLQE